VRSAMRTPGLIAALLLLLAAGPAPGAPTARPTLEVARDAKPPPGLTKLSSQIEDIQKVMATRFGINTVYVVGGSARAVLDASYGFAPLSMRDLDLFAVSNTPDRITRRMTDKVAGELSGLGYRRRPVEERLRGNPALGLKGINYNAGYGVFLNRPGDRTTVDLSLLHSEQAFRLNGPLNIDRIRIPIRAGETLVDVWRRMRGKPYQQVVRDGVVMDRSDGYLGWRTGKLRLVNTGDLWADVERMKPRIVKSYLKAGAKMPARLVRELRAIPQLRPRQPDLELRYVQRVLDLPLPKAVEGLSLLRKLGSPILNDGRLRSNPRYSEVQAAMAQPHRQAKRWPAAGRRPAHRAPAPRAAAGIR